MKNKLFISLVPFSLLILISCKKEIEKIRYEAGTAPVLTASPSAVTLEPGLESNPAIVFKWTNPDYMFSTGISSQDVSYILEMDTAGANFSSSKKYTTVISKDLSLTYTVAQLNSILGISMLLQLDPRRNYTIQVRVTSTITTNVGSAIKLTSNTVSFTAKPFTPPPKVEPPTAGTLWVTGDAFASVWANPLLSPYDVSQKFTKISNTLYQLTVPMVGGGGYKIIQTQGNWDTQYHALADGRSWNIGFFEKANAEPGFPGAPDPGNYKITVDFQQGKYTVVKQ